MEIFKYRRLLGFLASGILVAALCNVGLAQVWAKSATKKGSALETSTEALDDPNRKFDRQDYEPSVKDTAVSPDPSHAPEPAEAESPKETAESTEDIKAPDKASDKADAEAKQPDVASTPLDSAEATGGSSKKPGKNEHSEKIPVARAKVADQTSPAPAAEEEGEKEPGRFGKFIDIVWPWGVSVLALIVLLLWGWQTWGGPWLSARKYRGLPSQSSNSWRQEGGRSGTRPSGGQQEPTFEDYGDYGQGANASQGQPAKRSSQPMANPVAQQPGTPDPAIARLSQELKAANDGLQTVASMIERSRVAHLQVAKQIQSILGTEMKGVVSIAILQVLASTARNVLLKAGLFEQNAPAMMYLQAVGGPAMDLYPELRDNNGQLKPLEVAETAPQGGPENQARAATQMLDVAVDARLRMERKLVSVLHSKGHKVAIGDVRGLLKTISDSLDGDRRSFWEGTVHPIIELLGYRMYIPQERELFDEKKHQNVGFEYTEDVNKINKIHTLTFPGICTSSGDTVFKAEVRVFQV